MELKQTSVNLLDVSLTGDNDFDNHIVYLVSVQTKYRERGYSPSHYTTLMLFLSVNLHLEGILDKLILV